MISSGMAQLLVRNLADETVAALKRRAMDHGRSVEAEHRAILEDALKRGRRERMQAWWGETDPSRDALRAKITGDSTDLIREDRDR